MLDQRLKERFEDFQRALSRLEESIELEITNSIVIDGVIQRFKFTFEQSWKLLKSYLEHEGISEAKSPRSTIRQAFKYDLIEDGDAWISMMLDRNKTSHIYDENTAKEIYDAIKKDYLKLFLSLKERMRSIFQ